METGDDLAVRCNTLIENGDDFPTIWNNFLKNHRLVAGLPIQAYRDERPSLCIPLTYGQTLVFSSSEAKFSIE